MIHLDDAGVERYGDLAGDHRRSDRGLEAVGCRQGRHVGAGAHRLDRQADGERHGRRPSESGRGRRKAVRHAQERVRLPHRPVRRRGRGAGDDRGTCAHGDADRRRDRCRRALPEARRARPWPPCSARATRARGMPWFSSRSSSSPSCASAGARRRPSTALVAWSKDRGIPAVAAGPDEAIRDAQVVAAVTASYEPVFSGSGLAANALGLRRGLHEGRSPRARRRDGAPSRSHLHRQRGGSEDRSR